MFIDACTYTRNGKTYRRVLLRNAYRVDGKVRHDTLANLSMCSDEEINALKLALKHKKTVTSLGHVQQHLHTAQGLGFGAVWVFYQLAETLGLRQALGGSRWGKLSLWLIMATLIEPGSRLSATRLAQRHHVCDVLKVEGFNENDLYRALDELARRQHEIEDELFAFRYGNNTPHFYLYDVTSSYFEGQQNELAAYGYNRDKKKGKKQIVIGLMTDDTGRPIAIEVFEGNTPDPRTVAHQIQTMAARFKVVEVTLIGDRGMLKQAQLDHLRKHDFNYITSITKPQLEALVKKNVLPVEGFTDKLIEVIADDIRYVLHRNPVRAQEIALNRQDKFNTLQAIVEKKNAYLQAHPRAQLSTALAHLLKKAAQLKIHTWIELTVQEGIICLQEKAVEKQQVAQWDGCYVIKTNLTTTTLTGETIHTRYKELAFVEHAFRTMKTTLLEMRAIYVRKANRTRAHVFVIMLAYLIAHHLRQQWYLLEATVEEGIAELASICTLSLSLPGHGTWQTIPAIRPLAIALLDKLNLRLPTSFTTIGATVVTTKQLVTQRI